MPWRDLPARFGPWKSVHQRFSRWAKSGVFERIFRLLARPPGQYCPAHTFILRFYLAPGIE
jgi:transposase